MYPPDPTPLNLDLQVPCRRARTRGRAELDTLVRSIGNTPLVPLASVVASARDGFELWAKAGRFNPSGSVKDRTARGIVLDAVGAGPRGGDGSSGRWPRVGRR